MSEIPKDIYGNPLYEEKRAYNEGSLELLGEDEIRRLEMNQTVWWYGRSSLFRNATGPIKEAVLVGFKHDWREGPPDHEVALWVPSKLQEDNAFAKERYEDHIRWCQEKGYDSWRETWSEIHIPNIELVRSSLVFVTKRDAELNRIWHIKRHISDLESGLQSAKKALEEAEAHLSTST